MSTLPEMLTGLMVGTFVMCGAVGLHNSLAKQMTRVQSQADNGQDVEGAFALVLRDLRNAGYNPEGMNGYVAGTPLPFTQAGVEQISLRSDLNADGDTADVDEEVTYSYEDNRLDLPGKDTLWRRSGNKKSMLLEAVSDFRLLYTMSDGGQTLSPGDLSSVRRVSCALKKQQATLQGEVSLRNFSLD